MKNSDIVIGKDSFIRDIPVSKLKVDEYQREAKVSKAKKRAKNFNDDAVRVLSVSMRHNDKGEAEYYVVDGLQRLTMIKEMYPDEDVKIRCEVKKYASIKAEIEAFKIMNTECNKITAVEMWGTRFISGETDVVEITKDFNDYGLGLGTVAKNGTIVANTNKTSTRVKCVVAVETLFKRFVKEYGKDKTHEIIRKTLSTLTYASTDKSRTETELIAGFMQLYARLDDNRFTRKLDEMTASHGTKWMVTRIKQAFTAAKSNSSLDRTFRANSGGAKSHIAPDSIFWADCIATMYNEFYKIRSQKNKMPITKYTMLSFKD